MPCYCVIPDQVHRDQFMAFVDELEVSDQEKQLLHHCDIEKVLVDTERGGWHVAMQSLYKIPLKLLRQAEMYLAEHCGLEYVEFTCSVVPPQKAVTSLEEYIRHSWPEVAGSCYYLGGLVKGLLKNCQPFVQQNQLILEVGSVLAAQMLETKKIHEKIAYFLRKKGYLDLQVLIQNSQESVVLSEPNYITPEYLAALETAQESSQVSVEAENTVIFGKKIKAECVDIHSVQEEMRHVVFEGLLLGIEIRELRSGRFLLTFDLADETDGISCKTFFEDKDQADHVEKTLKVGMPVRVKGSVQFDKYAAELTLFADSMVKVTQPERKDEAKEKRIELHAHTRMSTLDGVVSVKSMIQLAAKWGHPAIAITDHGVVQAFPEAQEVAEKLGIKVLYGMEGYLFDQDITKSRHIIILAKNLVGLRNLYRLVSLSHLKYLHRKPRIPRRILVEHREGLIFGSACEAGELIQAIVHGASDEEIKEVATFYDYLEIQPIQNNEFLVRSGLVADEEGLKEINRKICRLGHELNKPVVATGDVHFLNQKDEVYRRILMAGQGFQDADKQAPLYLRTTEEMLEEFAYLGQAKAREVVIQNPQLICNQIEDFKPIPDELYSPQIPGAEEQIKSMSYARAKELYGEPLPKIVADRLENELNSIINHGFAVLYLIAHKLVKKSLDDGYLVGSRGSVGSSFVATMTYITEVNPLPPHYLCKDCHYSEFITDGTYGSGFDLPNKNCPKCGENMEKNGHDIPFAVFMGFHGDKVPDIDLNFSGDYQPVAHKYTEELFGKDNVFRAGTIATIADKTAYGFVKNYYQEKESGPVRNAHLNRLVSGCTGVKRTTGQHPGGIMVVPRDMDVHHFTPIQYPADDKKSGTITTHFDYHSISSRLVKLDILGHDDPTVIKMLEDLTQRDPKTLPFDDAATMSLFSSTEALGLTPEELGSTVGTFGIPEYGTKFVRQMLQDTKPKCFSELVRISGFSHGTDVWLNNAQDLIRNGTAKLSEAISARDDIMVYLIHKGVDPSVAFKIMECVRKGKGVNPEQVQKMKEKNVPDWYIESCQKIKYMFPKAHAVAYVMMAFRIAYCKVHYPLAFYAAYFSVRAEDFDAQFVVQGVAALRHQLSEFEQKGNTLSAKEKSMQTIYEMALEMFLRGFKFHRVDLYRSDATKFLIVENGLLPPLAGLQGLGDTAARHIVEARQERTFTSIEDLRVRSHVSKTVIDILREHGCLKDLSETDQMMLFA